MIGCGTGPGYGLFGRKRWLLQGFSFDLRSSTALQTSCQEDLCQDVGINPNKLIY